jgi:ATP-dependent Clp protease ATP-binding subunit ClpC
MTVGVSVRRAVVGEEHLFLALLRDSEGIAARVLNDLGVQAIDVRLHVESLSRRGTGEPYDASDDSAQP